jgi:tripartite-type tricarboxylate transporter receptor subunit TctC
MPAPPFDRALRWLAVALAALWGHGLAHADEVAAFYKGRTLSLVVGHEVGTGYDLYGRVLARHIGRHIPGEPQVVPQNMMGGGGLHTANWLYNVAPGDGSAVAVFAHTAILEPLLGSSGVKLDSTRFHWLGNMDETVSTCVVATRTGVTSLEQLLARETLYAGSGGPLTVFGAALFNLMGAKGRLVQGYKGSANIKLAISRGEVEATCGLSRSTLQTQWRDVIEAREVRPVVQFGRTPHPALAGIAHAYAYARSDEDRQVFDLIFGATSLGRPLAAPPAVPAARVKALRAAFDATMNDPLFKADAAKARLDIAPMRGEDVQKLVARFFASPKPIVERAKWASRPQ